MSDDLKIGPDAIAGFWATIVALVLIAVGLMTAPLYPWLGAVAMVAAAMVMIAYLFRRKG